MRVNPQEYSSFPALMAKKQSAGERKFASLRSLSDEDRRAMNDNASDLCLSISLQFGKSKRFVFGSHA